MCSLRLYAQLVLGLDGSGCVLDANCFSTAQQFTQTVARMDSGIVNTCIEHRMGNSSRQPPCILTDLARLGSAPFLRKISTILTCPF